MKGCLVNILRCVREIFVKNCSVLFGNLVLPFEINDMRLLLFELVDDLLDTEHCLVHSTDHVLSILILSSWISLLNNR